MLKLSSVKEWVPPVSFFRYAFVGILQNGVFYFVALILIALGWAAWQTVILLNPIAVILTFYINRNWSFARRTSGKGLAEGWRYLVVYTVAYPLSITFTWLLEQAGTPSEAAAILNVAASAVGIYFALQWWVFPTMPAHSEAPPP